MHALAAGRFQEALEAEIGEEVAHLLRGSLQDGDVEILVGIEIEHEPVRLVDMFERHAPVVNFQRGDLHEPEQAVFIVDIEIGLLGLAAGNGNLLDRLAHALHGVALEEPLAVDALGTAHQADRPLDDVTQHGVRHRLVIAGEVELGDPDIGIEHLVGARQRDPAERDVARLGSLGRLAMSAS